MAIKGSGNKMITSGNYLGNISRTKVRNNYGFRSTFSAGYLFPIFAQEIYPSMSEKIDCGELVRSITPLGPTMDSSFLDIFFFFVPSRLLWDHWEEFIAGYNKEAWAQDVEYTVPQIKFKTKSTAPDGDDYNDYIHSFLDYLPGACDVCGLRELQHSAYIDDVGGVAQDQTPGEKQLAEIFSISALYPRAYVKIWNDWFRDENLQDELELYTGDDDEYADEFAFDLLDASKLPKANKLHNRFTSALPAPVKGPDVLIPMKDLQVGANLSTASTVAAPLFGSLVATDDYKNKPAGTFVPATANGALFGGNNLLAQNVSNTIRMLRLATQTELLLARDAHGGTRYTESILSHFKVHNGDARLQRAEYLGSRSIPLNITQVTNTAEGATSALGNVGGQSVTKDNSFYFSKSFSEWGVVLGVACVRTNLSYSSGVRKMYQRKTRFEHIWPEFKHVGDVPLLTRELEINVNLLGDADHVFGYVPYGSELRTGYNYNNGLFRHKANGSLDYLTYQESYDEDSYPVLSSEWIEQPTDVVSNTLIAQTGPQFYALFQITEDLVIPLDPTSDPGLMDHF